MNRRRLWLAAAGIILLTVMAHSRSLRNGFVWDDDDHLTKNPALTEAGGLRKIWTSLAVSRYYPLTLTTFWVERQLWGLNSLPYHAVNILLHAVNAVLVWLVLRQLKLSAAWAAAALWAVHPVTVESVAWVTELKNTQSGAFFFLSLLFFFYHEDSGKRRWYGLALITGIAAMLSKPSTVVLPGVVLFCLWWQRGRWTRHDWLRVAPLLVAALGMALLTILEQHRTIERSAASDWALTMAQRIQLAGRALWFYAGKALCPIRLCFIYPRWDLPVDSLVAWLPWTGLAGGVVLLWRWRSARWARAGIFGLGCYGLALAPVLGFFDVYYFRFSLVADHFQYLASVALVALIVGACAILFRNSGAKFRMMATGSVLLLLGISTWSQTGIYQDARTLWEDTLTKNPQAWLAHGELGVLCGQAGQFTEAIRHSETAVRLKPDYAEAHYNLGLTLTLTGKYREAIEFYEQALRSRPDYAEAHCNLGALLVRMGQPTAAIRHYEEALRINPAFAEAHYNLGNVLAQTGAESAAVQHWQETTRLKPDFAAAYNKLGLAAARAGRAEEAIRLYERALQVNPDYAEARQNLNAILQSAGKLNAR